MEPKVPLVGTGKPDSVVVPSAILPRFDRFAVALKTGKDVALERTPIQLVTYLQTIRNLIVIGDGSIRIGDKKMIDVISTLYTTDEATQKQARNEPEPSGSQNRRLVRRGPPKGEAVKVDESSTGWRSDGHKNLPGFRELWKRFPDAEWYVMLDDDTYVFFDNLAELLSDYNPEDKLYIGGKNMFIGCDGVKTWGEGPFFAHGGSGIVISRGGMKAMMNGLDACIEKYKSCWAGDVRTALCMRDQGILLTSPGGFHKDPPNDQFGYPKDPCTTPATFHHLLAKQIQRLYDLEEKTREQHGFGFVTFGDLFQDWRTDVTPGMQLHVDRKGNDIANVTLPTAGDCEKRCDDTPTCFTYVYDGTKCWIKDAIPAPVEVKGFVSGVRPDRYQCKITIGDTMEVSSSAPQKGSVASR
ncbi:hypothetical protein BC832DRAFT_527390 [Gaertneriomyces semiglobifer]|nr:hypothetical protein BC832DRAFT_527390 [Gaertneriomyces semiglobifer]